MKHKFITIIGAICLLGISIFFINALFFSQYHRETYFTLLSGSASINMKEVSKNTSYALARGDDIITNRNSFGIIEWGDGSVTRLGEKTHLQIQESLVSSDRTIVQIVFEIFSGKTWSNVLSYVPEDSYFTQVFQDTEVAVRGTIFTLDADKDYAFVSSHKIDIATLGEKTTLMKNIPFRLSTQTEISLQDFKQSFQDTEFFLKNKVFDQALYDALKQELDKQLQTATRDIDTIMSTLGTEKNIENFNSLLSKYQEFHFLQALDGGDAFQNKLQMKEILLLNSSGVVQAGFADSYFFDFIDALELKEYGQMTNMTQFIMENSHVFQQDMMLDYLRGINLDGIINKAVQQELQRLKESFGLSIQIGGQVIDGIDYLDETARNKLYELRANSENFAQDQGQRIGNIINSSGLPNADMQKQIQDILQETDIQKTLQKGLEDIGTELTDNLESQTKDAILDVVDIFSQK